MKRINLKALSREIIKSNQYVVLGTVDEDGQSWVSPVVYFFDRNWNLYYMSLTESRHSRNIKRDSRISAAIFDSHQLLGMGVGIQLEAKVTVVPLKDTIRMIRLSLVRKWPWGDPGNLAGTRKFVKAYKYRFYKITPTKIWLNDPRKEKDERVRVRI